MDSAESALAERLAQRSDRQATERLTDVHAHVVPRGLPFVASNDPRWPRLEVHDGSGTVFVADRPFRTVRSVAWDMRERIAELDASNILHQVISPMPELFCYWAEPEEAVSYCRAMNAWLRDVATADHGRLSAWGILPMQAPEQAAEMLGEIAAQELRGAMIGSNIGGDALHEPRFEPVFSEAERIGLALFVHAFHPAAAATMTIPAGANAVTFPNEIGHAVGALIAEGVVAAHPELRLVASHGGGSLVTLLPRLDTVWHIDEELRARSPRPPSEVAHQLYVDSLVFSPDLLRLVTSTLGAGQVVFGTDYPFFPLPSAFASLPDELLGEAGGTTRNAGRLFGA